MCSGKSIFNIGRPKLDSAFKIRLDGLTNVLEGRVKSGLGKLKVDGEWRKLFAGGPDGEQHQVCCNKEVFEKASEVAGATRCCAQYCKSKYPGMAENISFTPSLGRVFFDNSLAVTVDETRKEVPPQMRQMILRQKKCG